MLISCCVVNDAYRVVLSIRIGSFAAWHRYSISAFLESVRDNARLCFCENAIFESRRRQEREEHGRGNGEENAMYIISHRGGTKERSVRNEKYQDSLLVYERSGVDITSNTTAIVLARNCEIARSVLKI